MALSKRSRTLLLGGFLAPIAGGAWAGVVFAIIAAAGGEAFRGIALLPLLAGVTALYAALIITVTTWTAGLVWHAVACARNWRSAFAYALFGATFGLALLAPILMSARLNFGYTNYVFVGAFAFLFVSTGIIVSVVGWLIRRPDRDVANPGTSTP